MTYIKVAWTHNFETEPVEIWSELDQNRMELRKVERFRNGTLTFAGPTGTLGETQLGESSLPSLDIISQDTQFAPAIITQDEFEQMWRIATVAVAA
jgi:hypothetical protein